MKKKKVLLTLAASAAMMLISCRTTPVSMTSSNTPVHDKVVEENLGKTSGESSAYSVLGLWMIGRPDTDAAVQSAIQKKGGDALINVYVYETTVWYVALGITTVKVEGEAVKLSKAGAKDDKPKK
jgi:hypothetical protein